ncbi:E3 ubiquitin-protein ligase TRIM21-like isoform X1 [Esox lucius]|uniref:E3 ubiquitin-protein ligase TRIM21-like isoform X1 n=1 Tax=Esox lucius TaxID=8010 RepID=UPI000661DB59|nr:E3 ubiquitin-protein ligase TRIM21-like isoform X1 [Esox lucius]
MATGSSLTDHLLSDHLLCSICVAIFIDPVSLKCQHTFCRQCLKDSLKAGNRHCPVCLDPIKQSRFKVNRILRDIMQELRSGIESGISEIEGARSEGSEVCPEHNQPLKLWCKKDKQLLCLVCRDSRVHQGHRFQPLDEAREDIQKRVASVLGVLRGDISKVEKLTQRQQMEVTTLRLKADTHKSQITNRFAELRVALKRMEEEELQKVEVSSGLLRLDGMEENLRKMNELLERGAKRFVLFSKYLSVLIQYCHLDLYNINQPIREKLLRAAAECNESVLFLRWWGLKSVMSGHTVTLRGDNLASPSRSFPRLCLKKSRIQYRNPDSLEALFRPAMEKSLKSCIVPRLAPWEPPLFGNVWDNIRLFFRRNQER